jgi:hypothetical protein
MRKRERKVGPGEKEERGWKKESTFETEKCEKKVNQEQNAGERKENLRASTSKIHQLHV